MSCIQTSVLVSGSMPACLMHDREYYSNRPRQGYGLYISMKILDTSGHWCQAGRLWLILLDSIASEVVPWYRVIQWYIGRLPDCSIASPSDLWTDTLYKLATNVVL